MSRDLEIRGLVPAREKVRRLTARQMRFIEYGWRGIFHEALFTFSTLFWSFFVGMFAFVSLTKGDYETVNAPAAAIVFLIYVGTLIYIVSSAFWQLGVTHYYIPGKSLARFRLKEETLKKLFKLGSIACLTLYALFFIVTRLGFVDRQFIPWFLLGGLGISLYFASKLIKIHGDTDQFASKYIADQLQTKNTDIILSYQSFRQSPRKGSLIAGATNEVMFSANHNGTDWITTVIPFSEIKSFGMCAATRRSFSLDQPLYIPSAARIIIQTHAGAFYKILIETPDGFQTNCFLFCKGFLSIFDRYLGAKYTSMLKAKSLKRSVYTGQAPQPEPLSTGIGVYTHIGRSIVIEANPVTAESDTARLSKRSSNRVISI
jgi:hypothetical protein